jgi:IS5 family transposase
MSDYKGAALMLDALPRAKAMLGDKGYDADWFRNALIKRGILPCIPSKANRKIPIAQIRRFIASAIKSKICSASSKTGGASTPVMIDSRTPSSQQSASWL